MSGRKILFYGHCQVQYIGRVYAEQIAPLNGDHVTYADVNHTNFAVGHHCEQFMAADILVDQVFDAPDPIPQELINSRKPRLRIPNIRGDFLWPFGTTELPPHHTGLPADYYYAHEYGDTFLNRMLLKKVAPRDAVDAYLAVDFVRKRDLGRIFEICMDRQRRRDRIAGVGVRQFIVNAMGTEPLFLSPGHPCERLLHLIARPVLDELVGSSMAARAVAGQYHGFPAWRVAPIHPGVGKFYSLNYVSADTRYLVYEEGYYTFEEYALRYMRGEHVRELSEALRNYHGLDGKALLALAYAASRKAPTSPLAYRLSSQALRRERRPDVGADAAMRALSLEPENPMNIVELVAAIKEAGDLATAESWARIGISRFPRESMVYFSLCEVLLASGNHAAVSAYADAAIALHPGQASNLVRAAHYRLAAGDIGKAESLSAAARRLAPHSTEVSSLVAAILARKQADAHAEHAVIG